MGSHRLFFGFEYREHRVAVIALDGCGTLLLRACFPLTATHDVDLDDGAAADIAATLEAFLRVHEAAAVCGADETPPVLEALARRLGGPVRYVSGLELDRQGLPGYSPLARFELGVDAHHRALLGALAVADGPGNF